MDSNWTSSLDKQSYTNLGAVANNSSGMKQSVVGDSQLVIHIYNLTRSIVDQLTKTADKQDKDKRRVYGIDQCLIVYWWIGDKEVKSIECLVESNQNEVIKITAVKQMKITRVLFLLVFSASVYSPQYALLLCYTIVCYTTLYIDAAIHTLTYTYN